MHNVGTERLLNQSIQFYNRRPPAALKRLQPSRTSIERLVADSNDYADVRI